MKVIAYLGFTLLSILIQFCVMDISFDKIPEDKHITFNSSNPKKTFQDLIKTFTQKPHALYYRTQEKRELKELDALASTKANGKGSTQEDIDTTTITNTIIDELYDESLSTTEDAFTTESLYTSGEFDNVTEISFFDKKNQSTVKPRVAKKMENKNCICNLLYQVCDINCCCDSDCSDSERKLFVNCEDINKKHVDTLDLCYPYQYFSGEHDNIINNLFCIVKINLPEKRNIGPKQYDVAAISHSYKWHRLSQPKHTEFERKPYKSGEPVWVLKEGSIWYIDIPTSTVNSYCSDRKPILFFNNVNVKCVVNKKDLEIFQILKTSKEAPCISVTEKSLNTTALNCSTLHCTNWTIIVCDDIKCIDYNKSLHEPFCTEEYCTNIAPKLEYIFYYYDSKIMNATIKLYIKNVTTYGPHVVQDISVKFMLTNETIDNIIEISGNPGYLFGRPVIASNAESNRSLHFFNTTSNTKRYLIQPSNKDRKCVYLPTDLNYILFGLNKRTKCVFKYNKSIRSENSSNICSDIEKRIEQILDLNGKTYVSPYGNPLDVKDTSWIPLHVNLNEKDVTYGHFVHKNSKLRCYNIVTRISYVFAFADVSGKNSKKELKLVSANVSVATQNVTFDSEDVATVLTIDINFIDGTRPRTYEYAAGPYINVNLPKDFFFPFRSQGTNMKDHRSVIFVLLMIVSYQQMK